MKNLITGWLAAARLKFVQWLAKAGHFLCESMRMRPALKRGLLAFLLALPVSLALSLVGLASLAPVWAFMLAFLFLGLGAERHALEWDSTFALPHLGAFAFWHWHALERKRFLAAVFGLMAATVTAVTVGVL